MGWVIGLLAVIAVLNAAVAILLLGLVLAFHEFRQNVGR